MTRPAPTAQDVSSLSWRESNSTKHRRLLGVQETSTTAARMAWGGGISRNSSARSRRILCQTTMAALKTPGHAPSRPDALGVEATADVHWSHTCWGALPATRPSSSPRTVSSITCPTPVAVLLNTVSSPDPITAATRALPNHHTSHVNRMYDFVPYTRTTNPSRSENEEVLQYMYS